MYHQYFGLSESPFSISVNPRYLFMSPRHRDALAHLLYGVGSGGGFILLTGEVGTGKTTINRCLMEQLPESTDLAIVLNPALSAVELLATVCDELEIDYPSGTDSLKVLTDALHRFLLANHEAGRKTVLMIDEAQHLDFDVLEQIRLLTNLETDHEKLLQIILIGQPELTEKLSRPELRQLNQRITARYDLQPLDIDETRAYIRHRLEVAGMSDSRELFPPRVVREIHRRTRGIPRQINLLCDRTLLGAYGRKQGKISHRLVKTAAAEVFGEAGPPSRQRLAWWFGLALAVALALGFGVSRFTTVPLQGSMPAPHSTELSEPTAEIDDSLEPVIGGASDQAEEGVADAAWLLSEAQANKWFWQLTSDAPLPPISCPPTTVNGRRCREEEAAVWEPLIELKRPVLLTMQTADRFRAATVVVAFAERSAWVLTGAGVELVPMVELARSWLGGYRYFWQAPDSWTRSLSVGDSGADVAAIAALFARLDGQSEPLTRSDFTETLARRVVLFQQSEGLEPDGVVGERTLLRLNSKLGISLNPDRALERARVLEEVR